MTTGKNFSTNNVTGQRRKSDLYETPSSMTAQVLDVLHLPPASDILEPAAGNGAISAVLRERGHQVTEYDIDRDFLTETTAHDVTFTNPPYSLAMEFILKAKELTRHRIIFLLPLSYLHGKRRFDTIYSDTVFPLSEIHVFTRYPLLGEPLRADGKYNTGMMVYAWYVWDRDHIGPPIIKWLDNNGYILNRNDKAE